MRIFRLKTINKIAKYTLGSLSFIAILTAFWFSSASVNSGNRHYSFNPGPPDSLRYPMENNDMFSPENSNNLYLKQPKNINSDVEYDPATNEYRLVNRIGDSMSYGAPRYMTSKEYIQYDFDKSVQKYWKERASSTSLGQGKGVIPLLNIPGQAFDRIFGSSAIEVRPQGSAELIFGVTSNRRDDPALAEKLRRTTNFDFQEKIQLNVTAKIGDKISLGVNYNTEASFDFENKMKLEYVGKEDEIIKKIEAGDVTLPLTGSLITGSQALFGIKTQLQFGKTTVTTVLSQQKSKSSTIEVANGAQKNNYEIKADQYDENKHFFVGHYFRDHYEEALAKLPIVSSAVNITKIEVWVTSIGPALNESRNIVAFQDLAELKPYNSSFRPKAGVYYPKNGANSLYDRYKTNSSIRNINMVSPALTSEGYVSGVDFEKIENARKLSASEFTFNPKLGFISLNSALNPNEILAVAYQYTVIGDTTRYQVGEFSSEGIAAPQALIVKLLKSTSTNPKIPLWKLMMKNVYSIGSYQINNQDFRLDVIYANDKTGVKSGYISEGAISGQPLIRVFNLDRLNTQQDPVSDGVFDFVDGAATRGGTINATNGKIYFPVLEPFGSYIYNKLGNRELGEKYSFKALYDSTKSNAQQYPEKNKYYLKGTYKSSVSSDISLNAMNIPKESVTVTSGGIKLTENVDYTVDYSLGRVKIINEGIMNSGNPIKVSLESNDMFNMQTKTLIGVHADHKVNKDLTLGATVINLTERPLTQKINIGDDPISNTIWGLDGTYKTEIPLVTKLVDKIPFLNTKEKSNFTFSGEFAQLIPGHARAVGKSGTSYIDDFEGSKSEINMKDVGNWKLASVPQGQNDIIPEGNLVNKLDYGFNRALVSWYTIDPTVFYRSSTITPDHLKKDKEQLSNHYVREVLETEVFPNSSPPNGQPMNISPLNLAFYPKEKGPYNYNVEGMNADGLLKTPSSSWGGIMRQIDNNTDFEAANIEYIEFWMMDPFAYSDGQNGHPLHKGGDLYFNLGDISEDILRDSRKSYENGLPTSADVKNVDSTKWGRVPTIQALVNTFENKPEARPFQDVGIDGLAKEEEKSYFSTYLQKLATKFGASSAAYSNADADPSNDDFHYFRGSDYDSQQKSILDRYKKYNGMEGNSPASEQSTESYPTQSTTMPDVEDINRDNTLNETERYYQYRIQLKPSEMQVGQNYITDMMEASVQLKNGNRGTVKWYQFKVPISSPDKVVGNISDFKSIRFMRMFLRGFNEEVVLRFATLGLVRSDWRKCKVDNRTFVPGEYVTNDNLNETQFDLTAVNVEENGKRVPIPYVLPSSIEREISFGTTTLQKMNEQSLSLKTKKLQDGDSRAVYKTADLDVRQYQKIKMFVHGEAMNNTEALNAGDLTVFMRLGNDFHDNYYEYEVPLTPTTFGASDPNDIWPDANTMEINLALLQDAKQQRNIQMRKEGSQLNINTPFVTYDGANKITVIGTPNLSSVKVIMIGVRNPKQTSLTGKDDGLAKSAEVWVNELRLTDYNEKGGWAANARISGNLADFGSISLAGHTSTAGFGGIEQKLDQRSKNNIYQYDIATNLELGKFFNEKVGLRIPMHVDYSENISNPQYNPTDPDILFKDALESFEKESDKDSLKKISQDYTMRRSINFMNVKKNKTNVQSKPRFYDISNFDVTYAYTELYRRNIEMEYNTQKTYKGALGYNFANNPKNYEPFKAIKPKSLKLIKDFNFYLMPKMVTFRTDLDRQYSESLMRNTSGADIILEPTYVKNFVWNRTYGLKFDVTKSLKVEFDANNMARIDEPYGRIDKSDDQYKLKRDTILRNIYSFGRTTQYNHNASVNYAVPINKINMLNWITVNTRYSAEFTWQAAMLSAKELGNTIENSNSKQINGQFNMITLYNKINYLKELNSIQKTQNKALRKSVQGIDAKKKDPKAPVDKTKPKSPKDLAKAEADTTKKEPINYGKLILDNTLKLMMSLKNASFSYTETNGTFVPGYMPNTQIIGQDWNRRSPGTGFLFGQQDPGFMTTAGNNGWISKDTMLNSAAAFRYGQNISGRASIEPIKDLKIELTAQRNFTRNTQGFYKYDPNTESFNTEPYSPTINGNLSMSIMTWKTAFRTDDKNNVSTTFENFKKYRETIAGRLANKNPNWDKGYFTDSVSGKQYPNGYGPNSGEVLIPAFLAAYEDKDAGSSNLSIFPIIPLPNWRITYNGLIKIDFFKKYFKTFTLGHAYRSTYNVGSYVNNINYQEEDGFSRMREALGHQNFFPKYDIGQISVSEQFGPLLNIDMTWNNSLTTKVEVKKTRDLSLSLTNNQLNEVQGTEYVVGMGYRIKDVNFSLNAGGRKTNLKSDINIMSNVSVRTNRTILRKLNEDVNQVSSGQRVISINTSADYQINQRFTIRFFFDKIINNPFVSSQFRNSNTNAGISLRFSLAQ